MLVQPKFRHTDRMQVKPKRVAKMQVDQLQIDQLQIDQLQIDELYREKHSSRWRTQSVASSRSPSLFAWLEPSTQFAAALSDSILWIAAAAILRLGLDAVMLSSPQFWIPGILVLALPSAIALILAMIFPQASWVLGYRLVLVMFGLLLGGRF